MGGFRFRKAPPKSFLPCPGCGKRIIRDLIAGTSECESCGVRFPFAAACDFRVEPTRPCRRTATALLDGIHPRCDLHLTPEERERAPRAIPARDLGEARGLGQGGRRVIRKGEFPGQHTGKPHETD